MKKILLLSLSLIFTNFYKILLSSQEFDENATTGKQTLNSKQQEKLDDELIIAVEQENVDLAEKLISQGANVNRIPTIRLTTYESQNNYPLHTAVKKRDPKMVKLLLDNGANANSENKSGWIPLYFITNWLGKIWEPNYYQKSIEIFNLLLPKLDIKRELNIYNEYLIIFSEHMDDIHLPVGKEEKKIQLELMKQAIIQFLLNGADPKYENWEGKSFFSLAKNNPKLQAIYKEYQEKVKKVRREIEQVLPEMPMVLANIIAEYVHSAPEMIETKMEIK